MKSLEERFWARVNQAGECWLWTGADNGHGYGSFRLSKRDGGRRMVLAHRMAYTLAYGDPPPGLLVRHTCDTPLCCRPDHLIVGTQKDNMADAVRRNRGVGHYHNRLQGEAHHNSKLTSEEVREIRRLLAQSVQGKEIAARFGITGTHVSNIKHGKTRRET